MAVPSVPTAVGQAPQFVPSELARRDADRMAAYRRNLDFYRGLQWESATRHRQLVFNYARVALDKVTSYLVSGLSTACYPADPSRETDSALAERIDRAEALLQYVREDNGLDALDYETELDCAVLGDACYKVTWDPDAERIRVTTPPVTGIYAWWRGDDPSRVWRVASRYHLSQAELAHLHDIAIPNRGAWLTELWTATAFALYLDDALVEHKPNPYGVIPFIVFPNVREPKRFWGTSDVPSLMEPQRELNRAVSQLSRILEFSGNPIAVLENVDEAQDIRTKPGQVWSIPEGAKAYLLDLLQGGGVRLHIDYIDTLYRTLHDLSETPRAAYGGTEKELSGAALAMEMNSLVQKVGRKRFIRTSVYHRRDGMVLRLAEKYMGMDFSGIVHRTTWGAVLPEDSTRMVQEEQGLVQAGIHSRRTAMDRLGVRSPDAEFRLWCEERSRILAMNQQFRVKSQVGMGGGELSGGKVMGW
ncbi:MAG: phage portal protein [Armatimonadetes bacterium]|nr:phage portal protein [Armatimonadota bacterium]